MIIGILSDTHGRSAPAKAAVELLLSRGAQFLFHCGDVGEENILDLLTGVPSAFVWGNNDFDRERLSQYAASIDVKCLDVFGTLSLDGKTFAVTHGDSGKIVKSILDAQQADYLFVGHTHVARDTRVGRTRVINPGALHRTATKRVALLDTTTDVVEFMQVNA